MTKMPKHYDTEYEDTSDFKETLAKNTKIIIERVIPELKTQGFNFSIERCIDEFAYKLTEEEKENWIDPLHFQIKRDIRPPDLLSDGNSFIKIANESITSVLFEYKDQPQENEYLMQGIPYRNVRTYLAIQHLWQIPVIPIFRDTALQETGESKIRKLTAYISAFKDGGEFILYGDLIFDMRVSPRRSYDIGQSNGKLEIRWYAQRWVDGSESDSPMMKPISKITELLKSGKIRKVIEPNPYEKLPLWKLIQDQSDARNEPRLLVPEGGLVYFTGN